MKHLLRNVTLLSFSLFFNVCLFAQGHYVVNANLGVLRLNSPLNSWAFPRFKINSVLAPDIGYQFNDKFYAGAALSVGILNGADTKRFFETTFFSPGVVGRLNLIPFFNTSSKTRLEIEGGLELFSFYTTLFKRSTGQQITHVPSNRGSLSFGGGGNAGLRATFPLNDNLGISVGYKIHIINNPWIDGIKNSADESFSFINDFSIGLRLSFENMLKKNEVRVDRKKYQNMNAQLQDLQQNQQRLVASNEAKLREKDNQIVSMAKEIDSLRAYIASVPQIKEESATSPSADGGRKQIDPMEAVKNKAYRIVVGSFPTQLMAQNYMERTPLNNPDMFVVYVEDLKTYRVIYRSYNTREAALKDLGKVRENVKTAWIIYF